MKFLLIFLSACVLGFAPGGATAATMLSFGKPVNIEVPDNNANGLASVIAVAGSGQTVTAVEVLLQTRNGWNGDMYAYLEHNGVLCVLLNRPGRSSAKPAGAASSGMQLRFADAAPADIHNAIAGTFGTLASGIYQPDARAIDPDLVTDTSPRSLYLSGFTGQLADGEWTLFVADLASGDVATLDNWGLSVTVVPEPASAALLLGAALPLLLRRRRCQATAEAAVAPVSAIPCGRPTPASMYHPGRQRPHRPIHECRVPRLSLWCRLRQPGRPRFDLAGHHRTTR
ncbi:MAG: proprotein convertase P-domain-containing protein [Verrucomicrobia bacterium]|nr:proprotein convertase P-domain-containing protein [Verrucomicrobiota bacterium]